MLSKLLSAGKLTHASSRLKGTEFSVLDADVMVNEPLK